MVLTAATPALFLGIDATGWAAIAAIGSLLAAVATFGTAIFLHRAQGARPRLIVRLAVLDEAVTYTRTPVKRETLANGGTRWPSGCVEAISVRIENKGRTPLTASRPVFQILAPWWHPQRWLLAVRWKRWEIGMAAFPGVGLETAQRVRVEPHDYAEFMLDARPLMASPQRPADGRPRRWHHVRVRVKVAGRRDAVARRMTLDLSPGQIQFSGQPETLRDFVRRYYMRNALLQGKSDAPEDTSNGLMSASTLANMIVHAFESEPASDRESQIREILAIHHAKNYTTARLQVLYLYMALRDAGFVSREEYDAAVADASGTPPAVSPPEADPPNPDEQSGPNP